MYRYILLLICLHTTSPLLAQDQYVIRLTDKGNSPYSVEAPELFLSQRAIERRQQQRIPVVESDLPVSPEYIRSVSSVRDVKILNSSKWLNTLTAEIASQEALAAVRQLSFVSSVEVVANPALFKPGFDKFSTPAMNHAANAGMRSASFNYGNAWNQTQMININELHDTGFSGQGMLIAVIDAGFQDANMMSCFDSLFLSGRVLATWDFVSNDANVYDDNWHGTAVLSTMASIVDGDLIGTAPHSNYLLLRSEDAASEFIIEEYNWASAAEFADSLGADVINSSLGYTEFDDPSQNHTYADLDGNTTPVTIAADCAASKGILVVNSAGNSGNTAWQFIGAPADGDSVLAVGAVDASEIYASFSSQGPSSDGRVKPDVAAQGAGTSVVMPGFPGSIQSNGTSFSSPVIAGAITCLRQLYPMKSTAEIMSAVHMSASQYTFPDNFLGYGIPDFGIANLVLGGYEPSLFNNGLAVIDFYPNPVRKNEPFTFRFYSSKKEPLEIIITDAAGKKVINKSMITEDSIVPIEINTNLQAGLYFISVNTESEKLLKKLVIY